MYWQICMNFPNMILLWSYKRIFHNTHAHYLPSLMQTWIKLKDYLISWQRATLAAINQISIKSPIIVSLSDPYLHTKGLVTLRHNLGTKNWNSLMSSQKSILVILAPYICNDWFFQYDIKVHSYPYILYLQAWCLK